jgi:tetratricopeptide (TPR) repeat protein
VNAKKYNYSVTLLVILMIGAVQAKSIKKKIAEGNVHYQQGNYDQAAETYEQVLKEDPQIAEAQFNKANAFYRQKKYEAAIDAYQKAGVQSTDPVLFSKAKYNLGNSYFNRGLEQQGEPEKAIESFEAGIDFWRQAQELRPDDPAAARNIEVARLTIQQLKQLLEQQQQQQQQQEGLQKKLQELKDKQQDLKDQTQQSQAQQDNNQKLQEQQSELNDQTHQTMHQMQHGSKVRICRTPPGRWSRPLAVSSRPKKT